MVVALLFTDSNRKSRENPGEIKSKNRKKKRKSRDSYSPRILLKSTVMK
jgi:hypothetical protein